MKYVLLFSIATLLFLFDAKSQTAQDSIQLQKADSYFESGKFKKSEKIYEKFALEFNSSTILNKAAHSHEKATGESYCLYFKQMIANGYNLEEPGLFFYGCDPKTFEKVK